MELSWAPGHACATSQSQPSDDSDCPAVPPAKKTRKKPFGWGSPDGPLQVVISKLKQRFPKFADFRQRNVNPIQEFNKAVHVYNTGLADPFDHITPGMLEVTVPTTVPLTAPHARLTLTLSVCLTR